MLRVLFICTGNTCRSPMAEGILRAKAETENADILILSAGVSAFEGSLASAGATTVMSEQNIDLSSHRSRQLVAEYVAAADLILTMTDRHRSDVIKLFPDAVDKTYMLSEFASQNKDVYDPFGKDIDQYRACAVEIRQFIELVWEKLVERAGKRANTENEK